MEEDACDTLPNSLGASADVPARDRRARSRPRHHRRPTGGAAAVRVVGPRTPPGCASTAPLTVIGSRSTTKDDETDAPPRRMMTLPERIVSRVRVDATRWIEHDGGNRRRPPVRVVDDDEQRRSDQPAGAGVSSPSTAVARSPRPQPAAVEAVVRARDGSDHDVAERGPAGRSTPPVRRMAVREDCHRAGRTNDRIYSRSPSCA